MRDHCHISRRYRGAAHSSCNLKLRHQIKIPVFFHNFPGYDSHLIIQALAKDTRVSKKRLRVIGQGLEKFLLIEWGQHYQFKDSLQFLPGSFERLGESLKASGDEKFFYLNDMAERMKYTQEQRELIKQKGICPYDWFDSDEKLKFPSLPERKEFDSMLRNEACSEEDYARGQRVWRVFGCKCFEEYLRIFLSGNSDS